MAEIDIYASGANRKQTPWAFQAGANRRVKEVWVVHGGVNRRVFAAQLHTSLTVGWATTTPTLQGYNNDVAIPYGSLGSAVIPSDGRSVLSFYRTPSTTGFTITIDGSPGSTYLTSVVINGTTLLASAASQVVSGAKRFWTWTGVFPTTWPSGSVWPVEVNINL